LGNFLVGTGEKSRYLRPSAGALDSRRRGTLLTIFGLTPEQRQLIAQAGNEPVRIEDPDTHRAYVLVREEIYELVRDMIRPASVAGLVVPEGILRSKAPFLRELADLMRRKTRNVHWAAYCGDQCIALGATETELYRLCLDQGLKEEEFYVGRIAPQHQDVEEEGGAIRVR
jgi:hypothetical protein